MRIKLIPYKSIHAYEILDKNIRDQDVQLSKVEGWETWLKACENLGPAYTLIIDNQIIGCGGVMMMDWNRGEAWTLLSALFYQYPKTSYKYIKKMLNDIIIKYNLKRVQATVVDGYTENENMMKHLGFEREGLMRCYGPNGEDVIMMGRVC